ncbi:MAG: hypothetical protein Q8P24_00935 [Desulfobacterales bacterium]|nr:hypothetical protein [Desulfobacterales bacterium]
MTAEEKNIYSDAHLFVAVVRVLGHQKAAPPSIDEVCQALSFSPEHGNLVYRKLIEIGAINSIEGAYDTRLFIMDHLKIEKIPRETQTGKLDAELKKFQSAQHNITRKVESFQAKQAEKKKDLFAELEKKLQDGLDKKPR